MKENYYFDNAATSFPKPEAVYCFMDEFARHAAVNPGRASHALAVESQLMVQQTRQMLAGFFGFQGAYERVVFTQNVTDSLNLALYGLLAKPDQDGTDSHVIASVAEHNSVLRPLNHLKRDHGVQVSHLAIDTHGYIDPQAVRDALTPHTKLVVINHGSNVMGAVQDIAAIGAITREAGVLLLVDTAQTAGVLPIDMQRDNIDLLAFTGHKGLFGPMGTGGLIVAEHVNLAPMRVGGTGVDSIDPYQPEDYPHHLEAGTIAVHGIAGLHAAQKWFAELGSESAGTAALNQRETHKPALREEHARLTSAAIDKIARHELGHTRTIIEALQSIPRIRVLGPLGTDMPRVATLSFVVEGLSSAAVGDMLDADYHVCVRTGLHCAPLVHESYETLSSDGAVRISPGYFTEDGDIEHLIKALQEIAQ